jgi:glycosyltransferase 2 family protein
VKHWGKALFGLAITVALLWWQLSRVEFSDLWANIRIGNPWLLLAAVFVATFGFFIRALRWKILLAPVKPDTRLRSRFAGVAIGFMANNILPARVGEFARAYAFSRLEPVTASAAFGSLVVERFMDGVVLLTFLVVPVISPGFPAGGVLSSGMGALALRAGVATVAVVLMALVLMALWPKQLFGVVQRFAHLLPKGIREPVLGGLEAFLTSIGILRDPKLLVLGFLWSFLFWAWHGISFWLGMLAFGIHTGPLSAMFTEAMVGFGVAIPSAPGFFGTFHFAARVALSDVYGVSEPQALAFAFGYHFGGWVPITVIGLWYAWKLGFSLGEVGAAEEKVEKDVERAVLQGELPVDSGA